MRLIVGLLIVLALSACGESAEDAYERGYGDGAYDVCMDIKDWRDNIYDVLRSERLCE
jgi:hypothetical protein